MEMRCIPLEDTSLRLTIKYELVRAMLLIRYILTCKYSCILLIQSTLSIHCGLVLRLGLLLCFQKRPLLLRRPSVEHCFILLINTSLRLRLIKLFTKEVVSVSFVKFTILFDFHIVLNIHEPFSVILFIAIFVSSKELCNISVIVTLSIIILHSKEAFRVFIEVWVIFDFWWQI